MCCCHPCHSRGKFCSARDVLYGLLWFSNSIAFCVVWYGVWFLVCCIALAVMWTKVYVLSFNSCSVLCRPVPRIHVSPHKGIKNILCSRMWPNCLFKQHFICCVTMFMYMIYFYRRLRTLETLYTTKYCLRIKRQHPRHPLLQRMRLKRLNFKSHSIVWSVNIWIASNF